KNAIFTLSIPTAIFLITIGAIKGGIIGITFFPFIERDDVAIAVEMPPGTRDFITESVLDKIEEAAIAVNNDLQAQREDGKNVILNIEKKIGPGISSGMLNIILLDGESRNLQSFKIANLIREKVGPIPEADNVSFGISSPFGKSVSVSLLGNNLKELDAAKEELKSEMKQLASLKDVVDNDQKGIREINLKLKEKAYLLGLSLQDVVTQVRQGFFGGEVQRLQRGIDEVKVWVRYKESERTTVTDLENMRIRLNDGKQIPLRE